MRAPVLLLVVGGLLLAGCGGTSEQVAAPAPSAAAGETALVVSFRPDAGVAASVTTLTCEPPGGDHPDPPTACADLAAELEPFAPIPGDSLCTELYGGSQQATVRGTYRGQEVALDLSRTDGCTTAQWDRLGALLPPLAAAPS